MNKTKIEWCDYTWSPVVGCTGSGCSGAFTWCYARKMNRRFGWIPDFSVPTWSERNFTRRFPRKPSLIFLNSISDVADWKENWIRIVWNRIEDNYGHKFVILSKRPWMLSDRRSIPPNAMLGYSATCMDDIFRCADMARKVHSERLMGFVSFLSLEPLHGPIHLNDEWLPHWVIVGSETGNRMGKVIPKTEWLREIFGFCQAHGIPLFFKKSLRPYWPAGAYFPQEKPERQRR